MGIVENRAAIREQLRSARALPLLPEGDGGLLLRSTGSSLAGFGFHDASFSRPQPAPGARVAIFVALCPLYNVSIGGPRGEATVSGQLLAALERAVGRRFTFLHRNVSPMCWRKGDERGAELKAGHAGCRDPTGSVLEVLSDIGELYILGVQRSGANLLGVVLCGGAALASIVGEAASPSVNLFKSFRGPERFGIMRFFGTTHPKFASPVAPNNAGVAQRLGIALGDGLAVSTAVVAGYATICASLQGGEDRSVEAEATRIHDLVRLDDASPHIAARPWAQRRESIVDEATSRRLEAAVRSQRSRGG